MASRPTTNDRGAGAVLDDVSDLGRPVPNWRRATLILAVTVAVLAALLLSTVVSHDPESERGAGATTPAESSAEAGFARDMQLHHAQAVEMSLLVRDRSTDPIIRAFADDIATAQQQQMGQMFGWLELWNLRQTGEDEPMAWMSAMTAEAPEPNHEMSDMMLFADGRMPGMASQEDLAALRKSKGRAAEKLFLVLMIRHHQAGIVMAETVLALSEQSQVREFATKLVASQSAEIAQMIDLRDGRSDVSLPSPLD